ncbi:MAG TPA: Fe-S-binding domain-containing protein, partial [Acidimicrobiales bacterium]
MDFPLLTAIVLLPLVGAVVVALLSSRRPEIVRQVGLLFSIVTGALTIYLLAAFETGADGFQFVSHHTWIESW